VDEVLAVGDVDFQRKCFEKLRDVVSKHGRTILLVSHNLAAIENLCNSVLLLVEGRNVAQGNTSVVLAEYLRDIERVRAVPLAERIDREGSGQVRFVSIALEDSHGCKVAAFRCGTEAIIHFVIENRTNQQIPRLQASFATENEMGQRVALLSTKFCGFDIDDIPPGRKSLRVVIPKCL
jgi:lipopolysaccharide transport system ATP-binding protein